MVKYFAVYSDRTGIPKVPMKSITEEAARREFDNVKFLLENTLIGSCAGARISLIAEHDNGRSFELTFFRVGMKLDPATDEYIIATPAPKD